MAFLLSPTLNFQFTCLSNHGLSVYLLPCDLSHKSCGFSSFISPQLPVSRPGHQSLRSPEENILDELPSEFISHSLLSPGKETNCFLEQLPPPPPPPPTPSLEHPHGHQTLVLYLTFISSFFHSQFLLCTHKLLNSPSTLSGRSGGGESRKEGSDREKRINFSFSHLKMPQ